MINCTLLHSDRSIYQDLKKISSDAWRWSVNVLNKHTDMISSGGILIITTCLLADKIFKGIHPFVPRLALAVFNFGGIIWLNVQMRDLLKSGRDLERSLYLRDWPAFIDTAIKVFLKTTGVLLTCGTFGAAVAALVGFPQVAVGVYVVMKPLGLANLFVTIATDITDYFQNESIVRKLEKMETGEGAADRLIKTAACFFEILQKKFKHSETRTEEFSLAHRLVRQLDTQTLETFQENWNTASAEKAREASIRRFFAIKDSLVNRQAGTRANLSLIGMGYISMGICRLYPNSVQEMFSRWVMSVLYTDELIKQKLFQYQLAQYIR